jgi:hypothetical protein
LELDKYLHILLSFFISKRTQSIKIFSFFCIKLIFKTGESSCVTDCGNDYYGIGGVCERKCIYDGINYEGYCNYPCMKFNDSCVIKCENKSISNENQTLCIECETGSIPDENHVSCIKCRFNMTTDESMCDPCVGYDEVSCLNSFSNLCHFNISHNSCQTYRCPDLNLR